MAQHDMSLDNATGANFRADLNNALLAIASNNSGSSAPSTTYALQFYADTSNNILKLRNAANDGFINLFTLAGGVDVDAASNFNEDVTFTGAAANIVFDKSDNALEFADNAKAVFGAGSDLTITHDGSNSIINDAGTGELQLQRGGNTILTLDANGVSITDPDGVAQLSIKGFEASGAKVVLIADEGDDNGDTWELQSHATSQNLNFRNDSTGSSVVKWNLTTDGDVTQTGHLDLPDSKQIKLGTGDDLTLVHDGSNSTIDSNTGTFIIRSDGGGLKLLSESNIILRDNDDTTNLIRCINGGQIELYHNGSKKAETVSGGFTVTGTCTATAFSGDGSGLTGVGGTTINNNADNRVITGSGTANTLEGESSLTYTGSVLNVNSPSISTDAKLIVKGDDTDNNDIILAYSNNSTRGSFAIRNGSGLTPSFNVGTRGGSETLGLMTDATEAIRITASQDIQCRRMSNTVSQSSTPSDVAPTDVFHFGNRQYRVTRFASLTASGSGTGTFNMGRLWIEDSSVLRVMAQVQRFDATSNKCGYIDFICMKNRGTGLTGFTTISTQSVGSETYTVNANSSNTHFLDINFASGDGGVIYACTIMADVTSKSESF